MRIRRSHIPALTAALVLLFLRPVFGAIFSSEIDLDDPFNAETLIIVGQDDDDRTGCALASGDFNGDGREDALVGSYSAESGKGITYIVFGSSSFFDADTLDLDTYPTNIVRVIGASTLDWSGWSVAVGRVNTDAYQDIIIGAYKDDPSSRINAGTVYVIPGASNLHSIGSINLDTSSSVVRIYGAKENDSTGYSVAAGDVNDDNYDDVIIGALHANPLLRLNAGTAYVIFGSSTFTSQNYIDLNNPPSYVLKIHGEDDDDMLGYSVTSGDYNGDGVDEVAIGGYGVRNGRGAAYVIPGYADIDTLTVIDLANQPPELVVTSGNLNCIVSIYDNVDGDHSGASMTTGDFNGDGFDDLVVGAPGSDSNGVDAGDTNVFFGESMFSTKGIVNIGTVTGNMVRVRGSSTGEESGTAVAAGDINGDGFDEILVGAPKASPLSRQYAGSVYVIWGANDLNSLGLVQMHTKPEGTSSIYGRASGDHAGRAVGVSDFDGDGNGDLVVGAFEADIYGRTTTGAVHIVKGFDTAKLISYSPRHQQFVNGDAEIEMVFNSDLDSLYVEVLVSHVGVITDSLYFDVNRAVFIADSLYAPSSVIYVTVNGKTTTGESIEEEAWEFYIKPEEKPPAFVSISPEHGEVNVSPRENIVVTFTDDVYPDSTYAEITGKDDRVISMSQSWADSVLTLVNSNSFNLTETINVKIFAGDEYGDRADTSWTFSTRSETTPPFFSVKYPGYANLLPKDAKLSIYFPIDIDKASVETYLEGSHSGEIDGSWAWADTVYTFTHDVDFHPGETLNLVVTASDIHRNTISDSLFVFTVKLDEVPPVIISRTPEPDEIDVAHNTSIIVEFSEDVVRDSTYFEIETVKQGEKSIKKTWSDYSVTIYPLSSFLFNDTVTVTINAGDIYANREVYTWVFKVRPEAALPYFTLIVPNNQNYMGIEDTISLVFPGDIDKPNVETSLIGRLDEDMPGTWAWADTVYTFTPSQPYPYGYEMTLTVDAMDIHRNEISETRVFHVKPDDDPPAILSRSPETNEVGVSVESWITINFSGDVVPDSTTVSLTSNNRDKISFTKSWTDSTLKVIPVSDFQEDETITVTLSAGDAYTNRHVTEWSFSTGSEINLPYYNITVPYDADLMGAYDTIILDATYKVDRDTVVPVLTGSESGILNDSWVQVGQIFTFTPETAYIYGETLTLTVNASDIYGNYIPEGVYTFKVKGDETPPLIVSRYPEADQTTAAQKDSIVVEFTDDIHPGSSSYQVKSSTRGYLTFLHRWEGSTLILTRSGAFSLSEVITVTVHAQDEYENYDDYIWTFTVRSETTPPTVSLEVPNGPNLMMTNDPITLVFSTDIDQASVSIDFTGMLSGTVTGEWVWNDAKYTFTPDGYAPGENLSLTVNGSDVNGNELPETTFALEVRGDETPPSVQGIQPGADETGVNTFENIVIDFTDDAEPDSTTVTVTGSIQNVISMQESWDGSSLTLLNNSSFQLGEHITVSVVSTDIYSNSMEYSWSFDVIPDEDPPLYSLEPSGDPENLAVNALIVIVFPDDIDKSTVDVSTEGSVSGDLIGAWSWENSSYIFKPSVNYAFGETITLVIDAADIYGNVISPATEILYVGEHTPWLIIRSVELADTLTSTYRINYSLVDPDNSYTKTRDWKYSIDGGIWMVLPESSISNNTSRLPGDWFVNLTLPKSFSGIYSENVRIRMEVFDGVFGSGYQISPPFTVDRNSPPSVTVRNVAADYTAETVDIDFTISDSEADTVSLSFEYSMDGGLTWRDSEPEQDLSAIQPNSYIGSFTWSFGGVLQQGVDYQKFRVRLTPADYKTGTPGESGDYRLDLNEPPVLVLDDIYATQSEDVTLTYHISDAEGDVIHLACFYSTDNGSTWFETANVTGGNAIVSSEGSIIWHSKLDVPSVQSFTIAFRAIPYDNDEGTGDETKAFQLFNNGPPVVTVALPDTVGGIVELSYSITDAENDTVTLYIEWSQNGVSWNQATVEGDLIGLGVAAYNGSISWDSVSDAGGGLFEAFHIRVSVADEENPPGSAALRFDEHTFVLDNEPPKLLSAWGCAFTDTVYFEFNERLSELKPVMADNLSLSGELTVAGIGELSAGTSYYLTLAAGQTLPFDTIVLTASNIEDRFGNRNDSSIAEFITDDNNDDPAVALEALPDTVEGDVTVSFSVTDTEGDTVALSMDYSVDSGDTWLDAAVSGTTSGLAPADYKGDFVWHSATDLPGCDCSGVLFRAMASDRQEGSPFISAPFSVDNNMPPSVSLSVADPDIFHSGPIDITAELTDAESDTLTVAAYYSIDGGETYEPATVSGGLTGIDASRYDMILEWDSIADIPDHLGDVRFQVVPADKDVGAADSISLMIDNFGMCAVSLVTSSGEISEDVTVDYTISDQRGRYVSLTVDYSADDGLTWNACTVEGATTAIGPFGYSGSFTWLSTGQIDGYEGNVLIRVTPDNGKEGMADTAAVEVDYNDPPLLPFQGSMTRCPAM